MIRDVIASLRAGEKGGRPAFTLLLGSGFSVPIIPTPTQMLRGDIAWWCYCKDRKIAGGFRTRAESLTDGSANEKEVADFERDLWKPIHANAGANQKTAFPLTAEGLPDLSTPTAIGCAYQAIMADGLVNNKMRRQYLRDAIARSARKVNAAHIFLAGILEAQESWDWGAPFCRTIFTTNFDPLLQRSLQLVNKLYYMSDRPDVLEAPDDDVSDAIHLVYTHGSVHRYDLLNTEAQIEYAKKRNAPALVDYFKRHGVIVIGYSGWADTTMQALSSCTSFDLNLYWCDIHSDPKLLRPEVLEVLEAPEKSAYYVQIQSADEAMRLLHRALGLGDVPNFIRDPVGTVIAQLRSVEVPSQVSKEGTSSAGLISTSLADLLGGSLTRLSVARSAFDDPTIIKQDFAADGNVAGALIAKLMSDAAFAHNDGRPEEAIRLWNAVIGTPVVPADSRATALYNRGVTWGEIGELSKAIDDYTAVIDMPDAPIEDKSMALYGRGFSWGERGDYGKEVADYSSIIETPEAPTEQKVKAYANRGWRLYIVSADVQSMINDSKDALLLANDNPTARMNLALGLLLIGDVETARTEYEMLLSRSHDSAQVKEAIHDLEKELQRQPDLVGAKEILEHLRIAISKQIDAAKGAD